MKRLRQRRARPTPFGRAGRGVPTRTRAVPRGAPSQDSPEIKSMQGCWRGARSKPLGRRQLPSRNQLSRRHPAGALEVDSGAGCVAGASKDGWPTVSTMDETMLAFDRRASCCATDRLRSRCRQVNQPWRRRRHAAGSVSPQDGSGVHAVARACLATSDPGGRAAATCGLARRVPRPRRAGGRAGRSARRDERVAAHYRASRLSNNRTGLPSLSNHPC